MASALKEDFSVDGERVAVVGMLAGRDPLAMVAALVPAGITSVVACAPDSQRALPAEVVAEAAGALGLAVETAGSVPAAVESARSQLGEEGMGVVTGSLYVVADARSMLLEAATPG